MIMTSTRQMSLFKNIVSRIVKLLFETRFLSFEKFSSSHNKYSVIMSPGCQGGQGRWECEHLVEESGTMSQEEPRFLNS